MGFVIISHERVRSACLSLRGASHNFTTCYCDSVRGTSHNTAIYSTHNQTRPIHTTCESACIDTCHGLYYLSTNGWMYCKLKLAIFDS